MTNIMCYDFLLRLLQSLRCLGGEEVVSGLWSDVPYVGGLSLERFLKERSRSVKAV